MTRPFFGCIADDFTGASDLASNLVESGLVVVQCLGVPHSFDAISGADAVVIALKTRSCHRDDAVRQSLAAVESLQAMGARRFYFKYCSTFHSTDDGNIGPVAEALLKALKAPQTIFCPAFPEYGRTVYQGHLFVGGKLLGESGMENHPLTPMKDANLVRVLSKQTHLNVGSVPYGQIQAGDKPFQECMQVLQAAGKQFLIVDALSKEHIHTIAMACANMPLVTGSSGLAIELPDVYRAYGLLSNERSIPRMTKVLGRTAILSGSCSQATQEQVAHMQTRCPCFSLNVRQCVSDRKKVVNEAIEWSGKQNSDKPILIYSTAEASHVASLQSEFGRAIAATAIESTFAAIASRLVTECGVRRMIVAGGETSGAVVSSLGVRALRIGPRIATGVPWTESIDESPIAFALKSGNFGAPDFFQKAADMLMSGQMPSSAARRH